MTKKDYILQSALALFAQQGYATTSTKQIAAHAAVSEGLIFKHFSTKEGLLAAVFRYGYEQLERLTAPIAELPTAREQLEAFFWLPQRMMADDPAFWRLSLGLKIQYPKLYRTLRPEDIDARMRAWVRDILTNMDVQDPETELLNLIVFFEGVMQVMIKEPDTNIDPLIKYWQQRYIT